MVGISHAWETGPAKLETNLEMNFKINCYSALIQCGGCGQQALRIFLGENFLGATCMSRRP